MELSSKLTSKLSQLKKSQSDTSKIEDIMTQVLSDMRKQHSTFAPIRYFKNRERYLEQPYEIFELKATRKLNSLMWLLAHWVNDTPKLAKDKLIHKYHFNSDTITCISQYLEDLGNSSLNERGEPLKKQNTEFVILELCVLAVQLDLQELTEDQVSEEWTGLFEAEVQRKQIHRNIKNEVMADLADDMTSKQIMF